MLNKWSYFDALIILKHIKSPKQEAYDVRIIDSYVGMPYLGVNGEKDVGNSISNYWQILIDVWKAAVEIACRFKLHKWRCDNLVSHV